MGQLLHGCARTTEAVRRAIQHSQTSLNVLAAQYGINPKTVVKWRQRQNVQDSPMGPKQLRSSVLTPEEEAAIVAFRRSRAKLGKRPTAPPSPDVMTSRRYALLS